MTQKIIWKQFNYLDILGRPVMCESPYLPHNSHDLLLLQISNMPKRQSISMADACMVASKELGRRHLEESDEVFYAFFDNWISWLTSQGYHIELTGDEFIDP